jgi:hypothetical protein
MTDPVLLKLLLSFAVGGLFVTACASAAERFGTNVGGVIGGIPSTIVVTLLFIGLVSGAEAVVEATDVVPLAVGLNGLFLVGFATVARRGLLAGLAVALAIWLVLSLGVIAWGLQSFPVSVLVFLVLLGVCYSALRYAIDLPPRSGIRVRPTVRQVAARATFSGSIITLAVYLSKAAGPVAGGLFSAFPAVFMSTLVIVSLARGVEFARALTRPLMISGMINVVIYAVCVRYAYPMLGLTWGTVVSFGVSLVSAWGTYQVVKRQSDIGSGTPRNALE